MRIGHGYDVHRLAPERRLVLGGVEIPFERGLLGHSDADVLTHAVMDALLGASALGDIGKLFPDNDPAYEGADSLVLLSRVTQALAENGYGIGNVDAQAGPPHPRHAGATGQGYGDFPGPGERQGHHRGGLGLYRDGGRDCCPCCSAHQ